MEQQEATLHFHTFFGKYGHDYYALRNSIMLSIIIFSTSGLVSWEDT